MEKDISQSIYVKKYSVMIDRKIPKRGKDTQKRDPQAEALEAMQQSNFSTYSTPFKNF